MTARTGMQNPKNFIFDVELQLKDAGLVASSAAAQVASSAKVIDFSADVPTDADIPEFYGNLVVDVTAVEIASNDELYTIVMQGSDVNDFTTGSPEIIELGVLRLGANEVLAGNLDSTVGRYVIPVTNERNGTRYRYIRLFTVVAGTIATGINFSAYLAK